MREEDDSDEHLTHFDVALDDATVARLMTVADLSHCDPRRVLASIVHDVLKEDEDAHPPERAPRADPARTLN